MSGQKPKIEQLIKTPVEYHFGNEAVMDANGEPVCSVVELSNSHAVGQFIADKLNSAGEWKVIERGKDYPNDSEIYWITYRELFTQEIHLGKGRRKGIDWEISAHKTIPMVWVIAVMPEFVPQPYQPEGK